jgi:hypothetical protein
MANNTEVENLLALHGLKRIWLPSRSLWKLHRIDNKQFSGMDKALNFTRPIEYYMAWIEADFDDAYLQPDSWVYKSLNKGIT